MTLAVNTSVLHQQHHLHKSIFRLLKNLHKSIFLLFNKIITGSRQLFLAKPFFSLQRLKAFFSFEEASQFHGIGAMKRAMQMGELALTNA